MRSSTLIDKFWRSACAAALSFLCWAPGGAIAVPVAVNFSGTVNNYGGDGGGPLASLVPLGTSVSFSLSFNETFSDGTYSFSDNLGPVTGSLLIGGLSYALDGYQTGGYGTDFSGLVYVNPQFTGTGPGIGGADFTGLFVPITPDLTFYGNPYFQFTTHLGTVTAPYYAYVVGEGSIDQIGDVPEPGTLALAFLGLLGVFAVRVRAVKA
jgi:hypothetical protein